MIPVINTNQTVTIAAGLVNGDTLVGQCNISHPTVSPTTVGLGRQRSVIRHGQAQNYRAGGGGGGVGSGVGLGLHVRRDSRTFDTADTPSPLVDARGKPWDSSSGSVSGSGTGGGSGDTIVEEGGNLSYTKGQGEIPLEARIERIFYINLYGQVSYATSRYLFSS